MIETRLEADEVDILIFAEGTYPFVRGGVAAWIFDLIQNLPNYKFGIVFLGAYKGMYKDYIYPVPENVISLQVLYLFEYENNDKPAHCPDEAFKNIQSVHAIFKESLNSQNALSSPVPNLCGLLEKKKGMDYSQFLHSKSAWSFITEQYTQYSTAPSFVDYFWNVRNIHAPLWPMGKIIKKIPNAKIFHSISTGYAGLLASMAHQEYATPLILTEHGLYSKERSLELLQSTLFPQVDLLLKNKKSYNYHHYLWINFFNALARIAYYYAHPVISLYQGAQIQQERAGAPEEKTRVIPNGIDIQKFARARRNKDRPIPKIVGFVGRIVRIKDVKTFLRAVANMVAKDKEIKAWIRAVGDEDSAYYKECQNQIDFLGLKDNIIFVEKEGMLNVLMHIGVLVLSSISEGMPLVVLESMAAGIPVIATNVGACRELIEGRSEEDKALGLCGAITPVGNAKAIASEAVRILNDDSLWHQLSAVGIKRVEKYYDRKLMIEAYDSLYKSRM